MRLGHTEQDAEHLTVGPRLKFGGFLFQHYIFPAIF